MEDSKNFAGEQALRSLVGGDDINENRMRWALDYLANAIAYYRAEDTIEPYPGRNDEAINDLMALLSEVVISQ